MAETAPLGPTRVGRYELLLPIASGGMATVYLARLSASGGFERFVALKLTHEHLRSSPEFADTLLAEAGLAAKIRHPNVVAVLDVGDDAAGLFLVMDYVEGDTLAGLMRRARREGLEVPLSVWLRVLVDGLAGLHAAHELRDEDEKLLGVIHRDFTPQNLLIGLDGVTRLADFGVAKATSALQQTRSGVVKGKLSYMSPQQVQAAPLDRRADVWAAGVILWELLAQQKLWPRDNEVATMYRILSEDVPSPRDARADVPEELAAVTKRALARDPDARQESAEILRREIIAAARETVGLAEHEDVAAIATKLVGDEAASRRSSARSQSRLLPPPAAAAAATEAPVSPAMAPTPESAVSPVRPTRRSGIAYLAAALVIVGVGATGAAAARRFPGPTQPTASRDMASLVAPSGPAVVGEKPSVSVPSASGTPTVSSPPPVETALGYASDAPLRSLRVDGREALAGAQGTVSGRIAQAGDAGRERTVDATAMDGRTVRETLSAGQTTVSLRFPAKSPTSKRKLVASPYE